MWGALKFMKNSLDYLRKEFKRLFKKSPEFFIRSPGRVNIIGEHSDYHDGYVMPAAINLGINWAVAKNDLGKVRGYSLNTKEKDLFSINPSKKVKTQWLQYLQGVVEVLKEDGKKLGGVDIVINGDLPMGGGLSSSSSLATGFAYILSQFYTLGLSTNDLTDIGCRAEWWYGTKGGNMDHFAISHGRENCAMFFDPRYFKYEYVYLPQEISLVIFETTVRHNQKFSPFAKRRKQAEMGLEIIKNKFPHTEINKLRDVSLEILESLRDEIDDVIYRRCFHPISERQRVIETKEALKEKNFKKVKENMIESHKSLKENYEVTCPELDIAFEEAWNIDGIVAARMTGGGFGGCTVNLVRKEKSQEFAQKLKEVFQEKTQLDPKFYICFADNGIQIIE